jgi:predicted permease
MLKNYCRMAWRNLRRNKAFSLINILGLSIGISAALVIYLVVAYDVSFNRSVRDGDRIYRVVSQITEAGSVSHNSGTAYPLADGMRTNLTGLDLVAPMYTWFPEKVSVPTAVFPRQDHIAFVDDNYFSLLHYEWLAGAPATSLSQPYQVVLTLSRATLYFPHLDPRTIIGRTLVFSDTLATTITGIVSDLPDRTDFRGKIFLSRSTLTSTRLDPAGTREWGSITAASQLFVKVSTGTSPHAIESGIAALLKANGVNANSSAAYHTDYRLQPLSDFHFNHAYGNIFGQDEMASRPALYGLLAIAVFLLLLACVNFINLTTAQSSQRAKEIGIRKTIGSSRLQLIRQFLSETFALTLLATLLSILLTPLLMRLFKDFLPEGLVIDGPAWGGILIFGCLLTIVVSLLAGLYPALVLSSYRPVLVLKNQVHTGGGHRRGGVLRQWLTTFQFIIAQVFVMATLLVSKQIGYSLTSDPGFKKDAIVHFYTSFYDTTFSNRLALLDKLQSIPGIAGVSLSSEPPLSNADYGDIMTYQDGKRTISTEVTIKYADTNYCRLYHIRLMAGRELPNSDTVRGVLINETYAHLLGFRDARAVIGNSIRWGGRQESIIGVVADFHSQSLHSPIRPLVIASLTANESFISVALVPQSPGSHSWQTVLHRMQTAWSTVYPEDNFEYIFQDESIAQLYRGEQNTARLLAWATGLAITISCLGLLGLVIYTTHQRTKEIGIRRALGASVAQVMSLLSAGFLRLFGYAFLIAVPMGWWGAHVWLANYAYRTSLSVWIFLDSGLLMGAFAVVILLLRTFKAAIANPATSLRTE